MNLPQDADFVKSFGTVAGQSMGHKGYALDVGDPNVVLNSIFSRGYGKDIATYTPKLNLQGPVETWWGQRIPKIDNISINTNGMHTDRLNEFVDVNNISNIRLSNDYLNNKKVPNSYGRTASHMIFTSPIKGTSIQDYYNITPGFNPDLKYTLGYKKGGLIPKKQTGQGKLEYNDSQYSKVDRSKYTPLQKKLLQRSEQARKNLEQLGQPKIKNDNTDQIRHEIKLVQRALNAAAHSDKLGEKYKQASENQIQETKDKFYPYKLMTNSLLTAAELMSAGYYLTKGLGKGTLLGIQKIGTHPNRYGHPVFAGKWKERYDKLEKVLNKWNKGQTAMSSLGGVADLGQLIMGDTGIKNNTQLFLDGTGVIGGTNVVRNTPWFGKYRKKIDTALDLGGYTGAGWDVVDFINSLNKNTQPSN